MEGIPQNENTPVSFGSKYLSHSFDVYQSGVVRNAREKITLLDDALYELSELEGGKDAWAAVQEQFKAEHGRAVGDIEEARRDFLERNSTMADYAASEQFISDRTQSEKHWLAYRMAEAITEAHNPRTPEYLERYHKEHRAFEDAFDRQQDFDEFREILDAVPEHLEDAVRYMHAEIERLSSDNEELRRENERLQEALRNC